MTTTNGNIVLTSKEAKIILDWDDDEWYIADIEYSIGNDIRDSDDDSSAPTEASTGGVKSPEWDESYKYVENDIVAWDGSFYYSRQNTNQGNDPSDGTFWWGAVVDLSNVDAITLEGQNLAEITRTILGGNSIADYYKKTETDNLILIYFNNVNAKKLGDLSLEEMQNDYISKIATVKTSSEQYVFDYINSESVDGFDQGLVDVFNVIIANDNINQLGG